jgi:hypothetical protein
MPMIGLKKCYICAQSNITRKPFRNIEHKSKILKLIHSDVCDLKKVESHVGNKYFLTFIDECTRYTHVYSL